MAKVDYFCANDLREQLGRKTARGGLALATSQLTSTAIQFASIPILARMLSPEDFGLFAMATVVSGLANMFVDAGLSAATVQEEHLTPQQSTNLFWLGILTSSTVALCVFLIAPLVAWIYQEPRLANITRALAASFVLAGLTIQHRSLLQRGMQLWTLALITIVAAITAQGIAVLWAWHFYDTPADYWALVLIPIALQATQMIGAWATCHWRPSFPTRNAGSRAHIAFGMNLTGFSLMNYFTRSADRLAIGLWNGAESLGFYDRAYRFASAPIEQINAPLRSLLLPAMSRVAGDDSRFHRSTERVLLLMHVTIGPALIILGIGSQWWIPLLLGSGWEPAIPIFALLAIAGLTQPTRSVLGMSFLARGQSNALFRYSIFDTPITLASFLAVFLAGPQGLTVSYALCTLFVRTPLMIYWSARHDIVKAGVPLRSLRDTMPLWAVTAATTGLLVFWWTPQSVAHGAVAITLLALVIWTFFLFATQFGRRIQVELYTLLNMQFSSKQQRISPPNDSATISD
jgi:PST family polysaccharide transporter